MPLYDNDTVAPSHPDDSKPSELSHTSNARNSREPMTNHGPVDIDQMLGWIARNGYSEEALGYATRRIAQLGTSEQLVTVAVRAAIRDPSR